MKQYYSTQRTSLVVNEQLIRKRYELYHSHSPFPYLPELISVHGGVIPEDKEFRRKIWFSYQLSHFELTLNQKYRLRITYSKLKYLHDEQPQNRQMMHERLGYALLIEGILNLRQIIHKFEELDIKINNTRFKATASAKKWYKPITAEDICMRLFPTISYKEIHFVLKYQHKLFQQTPRMRVAVLLKINNPKKYTYKYLHKILGVHQSQASRIYHQTVIKHGKKKSKNI